MTFVELFRTNVRIERDLRYLDDGAESHRLDLYIPTEGTGPFPVVIYFYGGGWRSGDKRLFEHLGRAYAVRGFIAVVANYRLTPSVRFPSHAEDCADAVAWVYEHIAAHGGDPRKLIISGHSAGAHLAALIGLDGRYLAARNVPAEALRAFVVLSGVYDLRAHVGQTVFTRREYVEEAFGDTPEELSVASPIVYAHEGLPPFLVAVAEEDPEPLREQGKNFAEALRGVGVEALFASVKGRDHFSIVRRFGPSDDPAVSTIIAFIRHVLG